MADDMEKKVSKDINRDKASRAGNPASDRASRNKVVSPGRVSTAVNPASLARIRRRRADKTTRATTSKTRNVAHPSHSFQQRITWKSRPVMGRD